MFAGASLVYIHEEVGEWHLDGKIKHGTHGPEYNELSLASRPNPVCCIVW